jgi:acetyl-CoA C-acetyltransferase
VVTARVDARAPVLVGSATVTSQVDDPAASPEPIELALDALHGAASAAGAPGLLQRLELILVPKGIWSYEDPGRHLAGRVGADARTVLAEVGILQQTLLTRACDAIASGAADVVAVVGMEAKRRLQLAGRQGVVASELEAPGPPDELLLPAGDILSACEIERDLAVPAHQYALIESALRHTDGIDRATQMERLGRLWSSFAAVAVDRRDAIDRTGPTASSIATPAADNRVIATPYTTRLCSQWNVDQATALLFASAEAARRDGVHPDRWTFPMMAAESNYMAVLPARAELHRSPAVGCLAVAVRDRLGVELADVELLDLYSCFPAAVQVQARELGIDATGVRALTVTGGMTFAGGPLNSYVLHATGVMAEALKERAPSPSQGVGEGGGRLGAVTSVSGMLTKVGVGVWSTDPPAVPWTSVDVSGAAAAATEVRELAPDAVGRGVAVGATVVHDRGVPARVVAVVEMASPPSEPASAHADNKGERARTVAVCRDAELAAEMIDEDLCGQPVEVVSPGVLVLPGS